MRAKRNVRVSVLEQTWIVTPEQPPAESLELEAISEVAPLERPELIARLTDIFGVPPAYVKPVERYGCVVVVATEPRHAPGDPLLPIPLVEMPSLFWRTYRHWVEALTRYLRYQPNPFCGTDKSGQLCNVARHRGSEVVRAFGDRVENHYFALRVTAALTGT